MHININMDPVCVVHAHPAREVCSLLADLELPHVPVRTVPAFYPTDLDGFTDLELHKLYIGLTGQKAPGYYREHIQRAIVAAVALLQPADVNMAELQAQVRWVRPRDARRYRYIKGAGSPMLWPDILEGALPYVDHTLAAANAPAVPQRPALPEPAPTPSPAPAGQPRPQGSAARPPSVKPAGGTVTERIYAICDEVRAANPDTPLPAVRKLAITRIVEEGINANSAGKGSGMWLKFIQEQ